MLYSPEANDYSPSRPWRWVGGVQLHGNFGSLSAWFSFLSAPEQTNHTLTEAISTHTNTQRQETAALLSLGVYHLTCWHLKTRFKIAGMQIKDPWAEVDICSFLFDHHWCLTEHWLHKDKMRPKAPFSIYLQLISCSTSPPDDRPAALCSSCSRTQQHT